MSHWNQIHPDDPLWEPIAGQKAGASTGSVVFALVMLIAFFVVGKWPI